MDDLAALKGQLRERMEREYGEMARGRMKRELLDKLSDAYDFEVPPRMLESEFKQIWAQVEDAREKDTLDEEDKDKSEEELREQYRAIAARRVRLGLLLSHVGEANELTVTQEEVNRAIMDRARQMPGQEQQVIEFYRSNADAQASLQAPIFEDKVVNFILEMANVSEREISPEDLRAETEAEAAEPKKTPAKKKAAAKPRASKRSAAKSARAGGAKAKSTAKKDAS